ncbi:MAG: sodium/solute symporter [Saprospiraceae bacterium]
MFTQLATIDLVIFGAYILGMIGFGIYITLKEKTENAQDYFLASRALPWWAVGGSLIASNISTEQILAMNGSGFELGMAIATYELMAAITLIMVAKFLLPVFLKEGIYTLPQFLERRYDKRSRSLMSVFWIALFVFINISSVLYLGALAIESVLGVPLIWGIIALVIYSATFSVFGGLKAVVWTDVVQVVVLVFGGLLASYFVLDAVSGGEGFIAGLNILLEAVPERFEMIFERTDTFTTTQEVVDASGNVVMDTVNNRPMREPVSQNAYDLLPGIGVLFGGMWITNLYYWGTNQYIIQRALAAKSLGEAQKGVAFAAVIKILLPVIVVLPGIAAYYLAADLYKADEAFPWVLSNHVPTGVKGLVFAGLVAAVGSSISSMVNSSSTIFTIDIYKDLINKNASELLLVRVGRISAVAALVIGASIAPFLSSLGQVFQFIQEFTGFVSPGVFAVFFFGMFWKRTTPNAGFFTILIAIPFSLGLAKLMPDLPFLDRMGVAFLFCATALAVISALGSKNDPASTTKPLFRFILAGLLAMVTFSTGLKMALTGTGAEQTLGWFTTVASVVMIAIVLTEKGAAHTKAIEVESELFKTSSLFNVVMYSVMIFLAAFYALLG